MRLGQAGYYLYWDCEGGESVELVKHCEAEVDNVWITEPLTAILIFI